MSGKIHWRCFHCGDTFTLAQRRWAAEHFGRNENAQPVCLIRTAGEDALLAALREAESQLEGYRAEDSLILRSMVSMQADHRQALVHEEERGYAKGVADARREQSPTPPTLAPESVDYPVISEIDHG